MLLLLPRWSTIALSLSTLFLTHNVSATINSRIDASRIRGVAPLAVYFDASGTTSTSTSKPFHEVHYKWNFGDPGAGKWKYGNTNTRLKNIDYGPQTAHVFDTPGTYTVTLSTKTQNGDTDRETAKITVTNPNTVFSGANTICYSTSGNFTGCPNGAKQKTTNDANQVETDIASGMRYLLRAGETFTLSNNLRIDVDGPGQITSFGGSARPIINATGDFEFFITTSDVDDWTIEGFELTGDGADSLMDIGSNNTNILFYNNKNDDHTSGIPLKGSPIAAANNNKNPAQFIFMIDNEVHKAGSFGMYIGGWSWAVMGNLVSDTNVQINRTLHAERLVTSHNEFRNPGRFGTFTLRNVDANKACNWCQNDTEKVVIADNYFYGSDDKIISLIGQNSSGEVAHGNNIIVERNFFAQTEGISEVQTSISVSKADDVSIRNNIVFMKDWKGGGSNISISASADRVKIYNNSCYNDSNLPFGATCVNVLDGGNLPQVSNNLMYSPFQTNGSTYVVKGENIGGGNILARTNPYSTGTINGPEDYALTSGGTAVAKGIAVPVFIDYTAAERTIGTSVDVGAYDSGSDSGPPPPPPVTVNLTASPLSIVSGSSSILSWSTTNAQTCTASGNWNGSRSASGSESVSPTSNAMYVLTCSGAGGSAADSVSIVVTSQPDISPPTIPKNIVSSNTTQSATTLSWQVSTDNVGVASYKVYKDGKLAAISPNNTSNVTGLSAGTTYKFRISALDAAGNESGQSSSISVSTSISSPPDNTDTSSPSIPKNVVSSNTTQSATTLTWQASIDNVGVVSYKVYKDGKLAAVSPNNTSNATGLSADTTYKFTISALDAAGNESSQSSSIFVTTRSLVDNEEVSGNFSNWWGSDHYVISSGKDIILELNDAAGEVDRVIFQVWSGTRGVEAGILVANPPYVYRSKVLDKVKPGAKKYVQALLQDSNGRFIYKVSEKTNFTIQTQPASPKPPVTPHLKPMTMSAILSLLGG